MWVPPVVARRQSAARRASRAAKRAHRAMHAAAAEAGETAGMAEQATDTLAVGPFARQKMQVLCTVCCIASVLHTAFVNCIP